MATPSFPAHLPQGAAKLYHAWQNQALGPDASLTRVAGSSCWSLSWGQLRCHGAGPDDPQGSSGVTNKDLELLIFLNSHSCLY